MNINPIVKLTVWSFLFLCLAHSAVAQDEQNEAIHVVPTFNSAGIYWTPEKLPDGKIAKVKYRKMGDSSWTDGLELYYLPREDGSFEFRGSIVGLNSGTDYEIAASAEGDSVSANCTTWDDNFKVKKIIEIQPGPAGFVTTEGGSLEDGYVVYQPSSGSDSTIDAGHLYDVGIDVKHNWVIVRGWKIKGVRNYPVRLHPQQKFAVVEYCDISDWGTLSKNFAKDSYGIFLDGKDLIPSNIVIQYNYFHDPTYDTNNWSEPSDKSKAGNHPNGTQPIWMTRTGGKLVIRYNTITGSENHYYNDGMGEWRNFGPHGFPYRDSDIHNNYISHCWDNCIEAEGGNINVRIYENFTDSSYAHYGLSNITFGPLYLFRNISYVGHKFPGDKTEANFLKIGNKLKFDATTGKEWPAEGRAYIFNNTILQPVVAGRPNGITSFSTSTGPANGVVYHNNLMNMSGNISPSHIILPVESHIQFDYNMISGGLIMVFGQNTIFEKPLFEYTEGSFDLVPGTAGYDEGKFLADFTQGYQGEKPDIGACESGGKKVVYGCGFSPKNSSDFVGSSNSNSAMTKEVFHSFPNPFSDGGVMLGIEDGLLSGANISIFNNLGQCVFTEQLDKMEITEKGVYWNGKTKSEVPVHQGLYWISIKNEQFSRIYKCLKI